MISNPKNGWCNFKLGDFEGTPSYITDAPIDLLDAFIDYYTRGYGLAYFDEEGSEFTLLLTWYGVYIIEEKDDTKVHTFYNLNISDLAKDVITDILSNLDGWCNDFMFYPSSNEEIKEKIEKLKNVIK